MIDLESSNGAQFIRSRVETRSQIAISRASGIEKTAVHHVMNGKRGLYLDEVLPFLAACGLRVVESDGEPVALSPSVYHALVTIAESGLGSHKEQSLSALLSAHTTGGQS